MDPLLDLLHAMQLTGGIFLDAEFSAPWCVTAQIGPEDYRPYLPNPAHVISYHYVTEGECLCELDGQPPVPVRAGEIVLLPRNEMHRMSSAVGVRPVSAGALMQPATDGGLIRIVHGGGGTRTRLYCGFLGTNTVNPPIADVLPSALTIPVKEGAAAQWIESTFRFASQELARARSGGPAVVARIAELLFIEAVRLHIASLPEDRRGWLAGLRDPMIGRSLALLHGRKSHRWTVTELAREVGASRSAFADRFTQLIGEAPIRYLARHRLRDAAQQLRESADSVTSVALDAGYESEAAFTRAFKREFGASPAAWRKNLPLSS